MILKADKLAFSTPEGRPLAKDISFELSSGEILLVTGANGSGKSTLLRVLLNRWKHFQGKVDRRVPFQLVAWVPQSQNSSVHWNLSLGDVLGADLEQSDYQLLAPSQLHLNWNSASGGERKRTLLLRALKQKPSLLLLDEPMNHLDVFSRTAVSQALVHFLEPHKDYLRGIVLISHEDMISGELARFPIHKLNLGSSTSG